MHDRTVTQPVSWGANNVRLSRLDFLLNNGWTCLPAAASAPPHSSMVCCAITSSDRQIIPSNWLSQEGWLLQTQLQLGCLSLWIYTVAHACTDIALRVVMYTSMWANTHMLSVCPSVHPSIHPLINLHFNFTTYIVLAIPTDDFCEFLSFFFFFYIDSWIPFMASL